MTRSKMFNNTNVYNSKINEDKARGNKCEISYSQGWSIITIKMSHDMLKYSEVYTNLNFVWITIMPLELVCGTYFKSTSKIIMKMELILKLYRNISRKSCIWLIGGNTQTVSSWYLVILKWENYVENYTIMCSSTCI